MYPGIKFCVIMDIFLLRMMTHLNHNDGAQRRKLSPRNNNVNIDHYDNDHDNDGDQLAMKQPVARIQTLYDAESYVSIVLKNKILLIDALMHEKLHNTTLFHNIRVKVA